MYWRRFCSENSRWLWWFGFWVFAATAGCTAPVLFWTAALVHEVGHLAAARALGIPLTGVRTGVFGVRLRFPLETEPTPRTLVLLFAGSAAGLGSVLLSFLLPGETARLYRLTALTLNTGNLLPVAGLDGGAVFSRLLESRVFAGRMPPDRARWLFRLASAGCAFLVWTAGIWMALRIGRGVVYLLCGAVWFCRSLDETLS